jgi:anaerobic magnesium-protoporphyrin IX monomethyl ester cyclase
MSRTNRVDVVLVNPGSRARIYQTLGTRLTAVENPVWAGLIATYVRRKGFDVQIVDAEADELSPDDAAARAIGMNPGLVAVVVYGHQPSASTQNMVGASAIVSAIKDLSPATRVLMLGGHVAALPARTLAEEACDFVANDEGLAAVATLAAMFRETSHPDLSKVPGLVYRSNGQVAANRAAPLVMNLDEEMPGCAWDLLPMPKYRAHNWHCFGDLPRQPYAALYSTLGCPYHCSFCCIQAPFKGGENAIGLRSTVNSYRFWSPERVVEEIDHLVATYGVRNIKFADEMFVLNERHVIGICDRLIERAHNLNIWAYARVDTVKPGMLDKLRRAGFTWLALGIEAANEQVLADSNKRYRVDEAAETVRRIQDAGISVIGNYIFGLPEDTAETMRETLQLALKLQCEFANFYTAMAYPGSPLYERARGLGWRLPDSWSGYSQHAVETLPLPTRYLSGGEVLRFRDDAFHTYFADEEYLRMIGQKFGPQTVDHIRQMTLHRLDRRYATA